MNSLRYVALLSVTALGAFAQGNLGGLTGVVSDTSSAVVPEVKITLTSEQTSPMMCANLPMVMDPPFSVRNPGGRPASPYLLRNVAVMNPANLPVAFGVVVIVGDPDRALRNPHEFRGWPPT